MDELIKCKIKLLNLQYFDAQGHNFILNLATVFLKQYSEKNLLRQVPSSESPKYGTA